MMMMTFNRRYSLWSIVSCITAMYLCIAAHTVNAQSAEVPLGSFVTLMHNVAGDVVLLNERVLEVRGFVYDGEAPAVYFWADTNAVPSNAGYRLNDGAPNNGCGIAPLPVEADGSVTYRVEFPDGKTINDLLGGSISLWCEQFSVSFGEVIIPTTLSNVPLTSSGPDLECSANVDETPVAAPTLVSAPITPPTATEEVPVAAPMSVPVSAPTIPDEAPVVAPTSVTVPAPTVTNGDEPYLLGNLTSRAHNVTGTVYLISDHIIEIRVCALLL